MISGCSTFHSSGGSPNSRPWVISIVPIAPSAMIGRPVSTRSCHVVTGIPFGVRGCWRPASVDSALPRQSVPLPPPQGGYAPPPSVAGGSRLVVELVVHAVVFAAGIGLVLRVLLSAIRAFILPRGSRDPILGFVFRELRRVFNP